MFTVCHLKRIKTLGCNSRWLPQKRRNAVNFIAWRSRTQKTRMELKMTWRLKPLAKIQRLKDRRQLLDSIFFFNIFTHHDIERIVYELKLLIDMCCRFIISKGHNYPLQWPNPVLLLLPQSRSEKQQQTYKGLYRM